MHGRNWQGAYKSALHAQGQRSWEQAKTLYQGLLETLVLEGRQGDGTLVRLRYLALKNLARVLEQLGDVTDALRHYALASGMCRRRTQTSRHPSVR
jgi:hypothetical protein